MLPIQISFTTAHNTAHNSRHPFVKRVPPAHIHPGLLASLLNFALPEGVSYASSTAGVGVSAIAS